jgi:hypothetical protein
MHVQFAHGTNFEEKKEPPRKRKFLFGPFEEVLLKYGGLEGWREQTRFNTFLLEIYNLPLDTVEWYLVAKRWGCQKTKRPEEDVGVEFQIIEVEFIIIETFLTKLVFKWKPLCNGTGEFGEKPIDDPEWSIMDFISDSSDEDSDF